MSASPRRLVPDFVRRSYVLKFGIMLLVLGVLVGAIGFLATVQIEDEIRQGIDQDLSNLAEQEANSFESWNQRNELVAKSLANSVRGMSAEESNRYLRRQLSSDVTPNAQKIHIVDLQSGEIVASTSGQSGNVNDLPARYGWPSEVRQIRSLRETRPIGYYSNQRANDIVLYAAPINGTSRAVVYSVDLAGYDAGLDRENGTVVYVVNASAGSDRTVLFDSTGAATFQPYPTSQNYQTLIERTRQLSAGEHPDAPRVGPNVRPEGPLQVSVSNEFPDYTGQDYIPSYATVEGTPFSVIVHTPAREATAFTQTIQWIGFLATLGGVLVVCLIGMYIGRNTATAIDRLRRKSEKMEQGDLDVEFDSDRIDNIGRLYDAMGNMRDALRNQIIDAREAREEAELARQQAEETSQHLQTKANEYRDVMQEVAGGDLSQRMEPSQRNEAMRGIAEEFNSMIEEIERTVAQLKEFANRVSTSSEEVTASAEEVRSASRKVEKSIREINRGAERQDEALQSVSSEMSDLETTVEEIASLSGDVADLSERTAEAGQRGREAAEDAIEGMNRIERESETAVEEMRRLEEEMSQIDDLIDFITDVADQTNMLALNANIEASRAGSGDSGEGFGVVAEEVKELAEDTKEAAEDIEQRLQRIQSRTEEAVDSVTTTSDNIAENTASVRDAVQALDEIAANAQETNEGVQEISAATREQAASTKEVVDTVEEAATISEETSRESENVAAAAEQQTAAMEEVSDSASRLSEDATRLSEGLDRFRTRSSDAQLVDLKEVPGPERAAGGDSTGDGGGADEAAGEWDPGAADYDADADADADDPFGEDLNAEFGDGDLESDGGTAGTDDGRSAGIGDMVGDDADAGSDPGSDPDDSETVPTDEDMFQFVGDEDSNED